MNNNLIRDASVVILSFLIAIILAKTGVLANVITSTEEMTLIGSFIAGVFFVSVFTVAPATVALGEIAQSNSVVLVAILGGLGALVGDLIIFHFVRDRLSENLLNLAKESGLGGLKSILRMRGMRWMIPLAGALIIASPLPDEIGVAMLGLSKMKNSFFIPLSYFLNSTGILVIGLISRSI